MAEGKLLWHHMHDLPPDNWDEANDNAIAIIKDKPERRNAVCAGKVLGKFEELAWIKACFVVANDAQRVRLISDLMEDNFPNSLRQDQGKLGAAIFYYPGDFVPDGSMD